MTGIRRMSDVTGWRQLQPTAIYCLTTTAVRWYTVNKVDKYDKVKALEWRKI